VENRIPEPRLDPPEPFFIVADCGCEVYEGENLFEWDKYDPKTKEHKTIHICPDCFDAKFEEFTREEKAELLGLEYTEVRRVRHFG